MNTIREEADENMTALRKNRYPGRGIVLGLDETGRYLVQVYWIMGRSDDSRNRVLSSDGNRRLFTEAADPSTMKNPANIIYNAMGEWGNRFVVSNGDQTDTIMDSFRHFGGFHEALNTREYEPDAPNYTPRITGVTGIFEGYNISTLSIIRRKSPTDSTCEREIFPCKHTPGFGYCIHTYVGDGNPLPSYRGKPFVVPLAGFSNELLNTFWEVLDPENRVALAVKMIDMADGDSSINIMNMREKV